MGQQIIVDDSLDPIKPGENQRECSVKPIDLSITSIVITLDGPAGPVGEILKAKRALTVNAALRLGCRIAAGLGQRSGTSPA